ncbi:MAG TPA: DUF5916 domain-containing protein, partial [Gemmatimonadota bacterium]|nr:DUF5916 domain-containing protein [Gemmatimonadota bacterium]
NNDKRTGYRFRVSASGVQRDVFLYDDVREDENWDAVWESAVHRDSTGWSAEIRIPLSQLRYNASDTVQSWGVNFSRRRLVSAERTYFALESRVRHGKVSVFGQLNELYFPRSARRIEIRPYALARANTGPADPGDPFFDGQDANGRVGLDFRYGLGASYTLDATINPDFGQVEVDPAVVNLTQFEVFFPEKRPFFVEDGQVFEFTLSGRRNSLFYSRRIGREPRGDSPDTADFEDVPGETTILTAAKLTGRSSGGLALGALAAITAEETGQAYSTESGESVRFTVEPPAQYGVFRAQQDFRRGASQVGGIFTVSHRNLPGDRSFEFLNSNAYSMGLDFEHNWGGSNSRNWALSGFLAGSYVHGDSVAMIRVQRSSNHYFQRPDATRFSVDSSATSLTGINWRLEFERQSARHWTGSVWIGEITPGFEVNDLGFMTSSERLDAGMRVSYQEITPGSLLRGYRFSFFTFQNWRHEALDDFWSLDSWRHARKDANFSLNADLTFLNYWELELDTRHSPQLLSDSDTRGGPLMIRPARTSFNLQLSTDRRRALFLEPSFEYTNTYADTYNWETGLGIGFRPVPSLEMLLEPQYSTGTSPAQYVTDTEEDVGYDPTYGRRYFFSDLKRHEFSLETRLNIAFNPKLTLQLYAQPLISSGDYLTYKQLLAAETFDFDVFEEGTAVTINDGIACVGGRTCVDDENERYIDWDGDGAPDIQFEDRNFNVRSLRLNAVLRWEYRPGSTIFLVWQQNRSDRTDDGSFDLGGGIDALGSIEPENVIILKVNYWIGL